MHIGKYINLVYKTELDLVKAYDKVGRAHINEVDVYQTCQLLSKWSEQLVTELKPFVHKYRHEDDDEPDRLTKILLNDTRSGSMALLRDLQDLYLIACEVEICCKILKQGSDGLRDDDLSAVCDIVSSQNKRMLSWLLTRIKSGAPQTLIVSI